MQCNTAKGIRTGRGTAKVGLKNAFLYDDPMFPTAKGSRFDIDKRLSRRALIDPDNPNNARRMNKEKAFHDYQTQEIQRHADHRKRVKTWEEQKKARMKAAWIGAGISVATGMLSGEGHGFSTNFSGKGKNANVAGRAWQGMKGSWAGRAKWLGGTGENWKSRATWLGGEGPKAGGYGAKFGFRNSSDLHSRMKESGIQPSGVGGSYSRRDVNAFLGQGDWGDIKVGRLYNWAKRNASGGYNRDDVPALLMGGEYVINRDAVNKYGRQFFEDINSGRGTGVKTFARGGFVTKDNSSGGSRFSKGGADMTNNVNITVNVSQEGGVTSSVSGGGMGESEGRNFAGMIQKQVMKVIVEQRRQGGVLSPSMLRSDNRTVG